MPPFTPPRGPRHRVISYNDYIDVTAAQVVFNDSPIALWQVPRDAYRQALVSMNEPAARLSGALGAHLYDALARVHAREERNLGETCVLGDNPLVLLTALQTQFEPATSSSPYAVLPTPLIDDDGSYRGGPTGGRCASTPASTCA